MSRVSDFDDYLFPSPQKWIMCMDYLKFFFTSEDKVLETTSFQIFTIKWLQ